MIFSRARRTLMLVHVLVMFAIIAVLDGTALLLMDRVLLAQEESSLNMDAGRAASEILEHSESGFRARHSGYGAGTFYIVWNAAGQPIFNSDHVATGPLRMAARAARSDRPNTARFELPGDQDVLVRSLSVRTEHGQSAVVQVGRSLTPMRAVEQEAIVVAALGTGAALLVALVASWFLSGRVLIPIRQAMERQRDFTYDASHELRTPLAVIDTGIQVLRRHPRQTMVDNEDVLLSMTQEADRMGRILGGLLALARADTGEVLLEPVDIDVDELVKGVVRDLTPLAETHHAEVAIADVTPVRARVDPDRIRQLLILLLDNALTHGRSPIRIGCRAQDDQLALEVTDRGPGIPAEDRERAFQRFHRASPERSRTGAGLGLPIARWIVSAHGGSINLEENHPGLRVLVLIPADSERGRARVLVKRLNLLRRLRQGLRLRR